MNVITVKYQGPTNHRGSRWIATFGQDDHNKVRVESPYCYESIDDGREVAVRRVVEKTYPDIKFTVNYIGIDHRGEYIFAMEYNGLKGE